MPGVDCGDGVDALDEVKGDGGESWGEGLNSCPFQLLGLWRSAAWLR